jgi:hypothetical protein
MARSLAKVFVVVFPPIRDLGGNINEPEKLGNAAEEDVASDLHGIAEGHQGKEMAPKSASPVGYRPADAASSTESPASWETYRRRMRQSERILRVMEGFGVLSNHEHGFGNRGSLVHDAHISKLESLRKQHARDALVSGAARSFVAMGRRVASRRAEREGPARRHLRRA